MFPKNEGPTDRAIRVTAGIVLLAVGLFALDALAGSVVGIVVAVIGLASLVTGATGRCVAYLPFGFSTLKTEDRTLVR
jgi:uncharacterized membrane protein HdeD (DUF308 family)